LLPFAGPLSRLAELARPEQRAILEQLPTRVGIAAGSTVEDVRRRLREAQSAIDAAGTELGRASRRNSEALASVQGDVRRIWPELRSDMSPLAMALASERSDEFVSRVAGLDSYHDFITARAEHEKASQKRLDAQRTEAKVQRLLRTCEDIVLAANLPKLATPEIAKRFERLLELEAGKLSGR
jgi:hypothetical protein